MFLKNLMKAALVATSLGVVLSGLAYGQAEYDNCSGQGYLTQTYTGVHLWLPGDPRIATTPSTTITLYGDAVGNFVVEKTLNYLRKNPHERGKRVYMWQDCGQWKTTFNSPPYLKPTCKPCVNGNCSPCNCGQCDAGIFGNKDCKPSLPSCKGGPCGSPGCPAR
jgi:hypothetical protein